MTTELMTQGTINYNLNVALETKCEFVIVYQDLFGTHYDFGRYLTRPITGDLMYDRWEAKEGGWRTTMILPQWQVIAVFSEYEWCPNCGENPVNLENLREADQAPLCDTCAREGWESAHAESLIEDGGL